jgi:3D (Asp-Asp-Asp) domain-containing protein
MISGIIHIFCCTKTEVETAAVDIPEAIIVEEPEIQPISLGEYKLTAYCACFKCCGKHPSDDAYGITKSGVRAVEGVTVAADPKVIPLGTEIIIDGHEYLVQDIGGAIKGNRIDVYFDSHQDALEFGVQYKEIFTMKGGEKYDQERRPLC